MRESWIGPRELARVGVHATEVCVVGAGPAGLALALVLRRAGVPCIVLERLSSEAFHRRAGAGLIEYRTVQLLDAERLAGPILEHGNTNSACEFRCDGRSYTIDYGALTGGRRSYIYAQHELVASWAQRLQAEDGQLWFGMRVTGAEQDGRLATVSAVAEPAGEVVRVQCRFVAGCDGARTALRDAIAGASVSELESPVSLACADRRRGAVKATDFVWASPPRVRWPDASRAAHDPLHARDSARRHDPGLAR